MRGRLSLPVALAAASLVGAGLACGGPRRGPDEPPPPALQITGQPASTQATSPTIEAATVAVPTPSPLPPTAQPAPTDSLPPQSTAAPTDTAAPQPDPLGDRIEGLLDQFDQANGAAQAELDEIPANP